MTRLFIVLRLQLYMKVEGRRPRLPLDSRGRLSSIFMFRCVREEMIVRMRMASVRMRRAILTLACFISGIFFAAAAYSGFQTW